MLSVLKTCQRSWKLCPTGDSSQSLRQSRSTNPNSLIDSLLLKSRTHRRISPISRHTKPQYKTYQHHAYSIETSLEQLLREAVEKLFPEVELNEKSFLIGTSPIGDYRTSMAYQLAQKVKRKPQEVAKMLADEMNKSTLESRRALKEISATGPGFVSFTFDNAWLANQSIHRGIHGIKASIHKTPRRIVIDHGSPNMSKEFHVGHLRSIMIGDCLARILRYQGHYVETVSHVGDFGTPMGLVIAHAMETRSWAKFDHFTAQGESNTLPSPSELSDLYLEAKAHQKADPNFLENVSKCVREIQKLDPATADPHVMQVYRTICEASRKGFENVYQDLNVSIPEMGESFYGKFIPSTIDDLNRHGLLSESDGALVCHLESWKAPLIVEKSDKSWLYGTTDLACLRYRLQEGKFDDILYVVDFTQNQHFEQVFEVGRKAGWYNPEKTRVEHVHFGVVQGSNGLKLSSRDGTPLKLRQLLDDAVIETRSAMIAARSLVRADRQDQEAEPVSLEERMSEPLRVGTSGHESPPKSIEDLNLTSESSTASPASISLAEENAPKVAYNAIKYFELSQTRTQNYIFSFQHMLSLKGNTSFYIVYAYARIHTLYRRAAEQNVSVPELSDDLSAHLTPEQIESLTQKERDLALKILQFPDIVRSVETSLMPHTLSAHLFQTSQRFHSFYESCRVIGSPNQNFRFQLCKATEAMLQRGLELLNVQTVNHV